MINSILTLVGKQGVEVPCVERHAAEGDLSAFSVDVALLFVGLYAAQTESRAPVDDPSAVPSIARILREYNIVVVNPSNGVCVMNKPDVATHADALCSLADVCLFFF